MNNAVGGRKSIRYSLTGLLVLVTFCGFGSCVLRALISRVSGENTSAEQANKMLGHVGSPLEVPSTAKNVTFRATFIFAYATFEVEEGDFVDWAKKRPHWKLEPIVDDRCQAIRNLLGVQGCSVPPSIVNGLSFTNSSHRGGWNVVYDRDEKRAWVDYAHH